MIRDDFANLIEADAGRGDIGGGAVARLGDFFQLAGRRLRAGHRAIGGDLEMQQDEGAGAAAIGVVGRAAQEG